MLQRDHGKSSRAPASATRCARPPGCSRTGATATQWPPSGLRGDARGAPGAGVPDGGDHRFKAMYSCGPGQQAVALAAGGGAGGSCVSVHLGEMYAEEERELLVEVRTPL